MAGSIPACCCLPNRIASPIWRECSEWPSTIDAFFGTAISDDERSSALAAGRTCCLKNLLTDIAGVRVGHADDAALASGVTAVIFDKPAVASSDVRGGGPGTREETVLDLQSTVEAIDAIALSGGSALGLDAAGGVQAWLAERGRGLRIREAA